MCFTERVGGGGGGGAEEGEEEELEEEKERHFFFLLVCYAYASIARRENLGCVLFGHKR